MIRDRSGPNQARSIRDARRADLSLLDEVSPLPDWSQLGRHILAEAMRRAMTRMDERLAQATGSFDPQAKELS